MTVSNTSIKATAKNIIKPNRLKNFAVCTIVLSVWLIYYNISAIISFLTSEAMFLIAISIFSFLILSPFLLGLVRYFWRQFCGQNDDVIEIFYYLSSKKLYIKTLHLVFSLSFRIALMYIVFSIPIYILEFITGSWLYNALNVSIPIWTANISNLSGFLGIISITATVIYSLKFYLAPMLFVADENIDIAEALHLSSVISRRTMLDFIFLAFSFLGYILLSILILPLIFTLPYMIVTYLIHCSFAVESFNEEISKINHDDIPTFVAGV